MKHFKTLATKAAFLAVPIAFLVIETAPRIHP